MAAAAKTGRTGVILLFGMFQVVLGSTVPSGLYAIYERDWGLSRVQTTLVFASYVAGVLCSLVFLGGLADRFGRKPAILLSVALAACSSVTFLVAAGPSLLIVARFFSGLSVGVCTGAFTSALNDHYGRSHGSALSAVVTSAALAAGPLASAVLATTLPLPVRLPFLVHLLMIALVFLGCARLPRGSHKHHHVSDTNGAGRAIFPTKAAFLLFLCCASVIGWAYGANGMWQSVVPLSINGINSQLHIASITALMLGVSAIAQWMTLKRTPEKILPMGLVLLAVGFAATAYGAATQHTWLVLTATCLVGIGQGMAFRSSLSLAAHSASPHKQATAISLYYIFGYAMTAVLPLLSNVNGVVPILYCMVALTVASLVVTPFATKKGIH